MRRWFRVSLVWGAALLLDAAAHAAVILLLPIAAAASLSPVLMLITYGALVVWTVHTARRRALQAEHPRVGE